MEHTLHSYSRVIIGFMKQAYFWEPKVDSEPRHLLSFMELASLISTFKIIGSWIPFVIFAIILTQLCNLVPICVSSLVAFHSTLHNWLRSVQTAPIWRNIPWLQEAHLRQINIKYHYIICNFIYIYSVLRTNLIFNMLFKYQPRRVQFPALPDFLIINGLERGPLNTVMVTEELLEERLAASV
jgi:hypothetical protein